MPSWNLWATESGSGFEHFGSQVFVSAYGGEPVAVTLVEDAAGPYWGWLRTGADMPMMVYAREEQFRVCFPYGAEEGERESKGRIVRLRAERTPRTWTMCAGYSADRGEFAHFGPAWYVREYGETDIAEVLCTEDPDGPYWSWTSDSEPVPCMVQPSEFLFRVQFEYGYEPEVGKRGGRVVRLRAERVRTLTAEEVARA